MVAEDNDLDHDFETYLERVNCFNVFQLKHEDRCHFVQTVPDCTESVNYIPYIQFMECYLKAHSRIAEWVAIVLLISFVLYLGLIIGIVADSFFGPALKVISNLLHMSDHLAGVTLLAFGNSSPDLLSNIAAIGEGDPMFTNCMSNSIFITMVAGGLVCFLRPFKMKGHETVRDVMFFMAGLLVLDYAIQDGVVGRLESACCIGIYLLYIVVTVTDIYLLNRDLQKKAQLKKSSLDDINKPSKDIDEHPSQFFKVKRQADPSQVSFTTRVSKSREFIDINVTKYAQYDISHSKLYNLFDDFVNSIKPFQRNEWKESSLCNKLFLLLKAPIRLIAKIYIPVVDLEEEKHGWSKLLNCLQIIINVPMGLIITNHEEKLAYTLYSVVLTIPIALAVFLHSRTDLPPFYHFLFAILSCIGSLLFIYAAATEIEAVLKLVGNILSLSEDFCGATINAWGGTIGDLIATIVLALQGNETMAFAACLAGPFFTMLISAGIVYSYESWESSTGWTAVDNGKYGDNAFAFLMMSLSSTLLWSTTFNFQARRSVGFFSLFLYGLYLLFAVLSEKEVIHTYAEDEPIEVL